MAEPGLSELITTTLRHRTEELKDNVTNNNAITLSMKENDGLEEVDGGRTLVEEQFYAENSSFQRFEGAEVLNVSYNPTMTAAEYEWKQFACAVVINGREMRQNSGKEGIIKLLSSRIKAAEMTLDNNLNSDMLSDGTADGGKQIGGLALLVSKTPTSGTVGGIDRSAAGGAYFRNYKLQPATDTALGATSAANIKQLYDKVLNNITRGKDRTKIILAGNDHFEFLQVAMQAIQRITSEAGVIAKAGFKTLEFQGIPVVLGGGVSFGGESLVQSDLSYFLNTSYLKLKSHKLCNMDPLPEVQSINQDAKVQLIAWMGNMTLSNAKLQAVMFDS